MRRGVCVCVYELQCNSFRLKQLFSAKDMPNLKQNLISVFLNLGLEYSFVLLITCWWGLRYFIYLSLCSLPLKSRHKDPCLSVSGSWAFVWWISHPKVGGCNWDVMGNWVRGRISSWGCWKWRSKFLSKDAQLNPAISVKRETVKGSTFDECAENAIS